MAKPKQDNPKRLEWEESFERTKDCKHSTVFLYTMKDGQRFTVYVPHSIFAGKAAPERLCIRIWS